ncbi:MAG: CopG family transcriptional regulator [Solirubrobacteraceae bacterium]
MPRTQVYIGEEELEALDNAARTAGASRSELIRRAVRESYGLKTKADRTRALRASAGSWKGRNFTGARYIDGIRGDLNDRLRRHGLN